MIYGKPIWEYEIEVLEKDPVKVMSIAFPYTDIVDVSTKNIDPNINPLKNIPASFLAPFAASKGIEAFSIRDVIQVPGPSYNDAKVIFLIEEIGTSECNPEFRSVREAVEYHKESYLSFQRYNSGNGVE